MEEASLLDAVGSEDLVEMREPSLGQRLATERKAQKLSRKLIAEKLNLSETHIESIEADQLDALPTPIFARGYVRAYGKRLGFDEQDILAHFERQAGLVQAVPEKEKFKFNGRKLRSLLMRTIGYSVGGAVLTLSISWWSDHGESAVIAADVSYADAMALDAASENVGAQTSTGEGAEETVLAGSTLTAIKPHRLEAHFADSSWIEVRTPQDDVLFTGVKQAGEILSLTGQSRFDLVVGNAAAVRLSLNGDLVDLAAHADERNLARLTLIP